MVLFFYFFSAWMVFSSLAVVFSSKPISSVLWLVLAFLSSSGLFILLGAELIAISIVIVYVGAVAVLFLFVVMMLGGNAETTSKKLSSIKVINGLIAAIFLYSISLIAIKSLDNTHRKNALLNTEKFKLAMDRSVNHQINTDDKIAENITNAHAIGQVLYTDYIIIFQISGFILLTAMIGSIVLTIRDRKSGKRQDTNSHKRIQHQFNTAFFGRTSLLIALRF